LIVDATERFPVHSFKPNFPLPQNINH